MSTGRQYRLIRELGTGTFGTVFQAEMEGAGGFVKHVALKVLHPRWEGDTDLAKRFRDEARLLGQLHNRNIVRVDGLVRVGGRWAVVMEFVPGSDCHLVVKACRRAREPFPVPAALEIVAAVASALDSAYNATNLDTDGPLRVIHRDIKPSNIRISDDGGVKVLDFGIARAEFPGREAITHSVRYGSLRYMSPQRRLTEPDSASDDIYSLGAVLFELLIGRPLGEAQTEWAQHTELVLHARAEVAERLGPQAAAEVTLDLMARMLDFQAAERPSAGYVYRTAAELCRKIEGESLASFAGRFLPQMFEHVSDPTKPISRTVSGEDGSSDEVLVAGSDAETILPRAFTDEERDPSDAPIAPIPLSPRRRRSPGVVVVGVAVASALLAILSVIGVVLAFQPSRTEPVAIGNDPPTATSPPPPAVDPPPVEEPTADTDETAPAVVEIDTEPDPTPVPPNRAPPTLPDPPTPPPGTADDPEEPTPVETADTTGTSTGPLAVVEPPAADTEGLITIRAVKFAIAGASEISARCQGARATGTASALVREPYPGPCTVVARVDGRDYQAVVDVTDSGGVTCEIAAEELVCR